MLLMLSKLKFIQGEIDKAQVHFSKDYEKRANGIFAAVVTLLVSLDDDFFINAQKSKIKDLSSEIKKLVLAEYKQGEEAFVKRAHLLQAFASHHIAGHISTHSTMNAKSVIKDTLIDNVMYCSGDTLHEHFIRHAKYEVSRLIKIIKEAVGRKLVLSEVMQVLRGTREHGFKDGYMKKASGMARNIIDTACQHVYQQAIKLTMSANDIEEYEISSTLDNRTSETCRNLDGKRFNIGDPSAIYPPFHARCRTSIVPVLSQSFECKKRASSDGYVSNMNYSQWEKQRAL